MIECGECGARMVLRSSPKFRRKFWGCVRFPECRGTHGAHPDGTPLGIPANAQTNRARIAAHDAFDKIWKRGNQRGRARKREKAYVFLQGAMGLSKTECHIGRFTIEQCEAVLRICAERAAANV